MGFNCGIVGLPNVGKSTIFNAISKAGAESANYPFCTIEPNRGIVPVPDDRMDFITQHVKPKSKVPTAIEFIDIAGLVKGASKGEGLGNQFLSHIRQVDAIAHVVRCFESEGIVHVEGSVDPARDVEIINTELLLADMEMLEKAQQKAQKQAKSGDKEWKKKAEVLTAILDAVNDGTPVRLVPEYIEHGETILREYPFMTAKPIMYVANVDEDTLTSGTNEHVETVKKIAEKERAAMVVISGAVESEIAELDPEEAAEFLAEMGLEHSGLDLMVLAGYRLLGLITYFTAGEKEVRAWTIENGTTAQKAAGKIHSDIERGFIRAEVISYDDFVTTPSLSRLKELGKMRLEGKDYVVADGDIIHFRFNV